MPINMSVATEWTVNASLMTKLVKMVSNVVNVTLYSVSIFLPKKKGTRLEFFCLAISTVKKWTHYWMWGTMTSDIIHIYYILLQFCLYCSLTSVIVIKRERLLTIQQIILEKCNRNGKMYNTDNAFWLTWHLIEIWTLAIACVYESICCLVEDMTNSFLWCAEMTRSCQSWEDFQF